MSAPKTVTVACYIPQVSADTTHALVHGQTGEYQIKSAYWLPTEVTADGGSNKYTITLKQGGTACSSALDSDAAGWAVGTAYEFTLSSAGPSLEFGASDVCQLVFDETGTATCSGNLVVTFEQVRV